jgi:hypothetical protein
MSQAFNIHELNFGINTQKKKPLNYRSIFKKAQPFDMHV